MTSIDVKTLYVSSIDSTPVTVESWSDVLGEDMDEGGWWETFTYEFSDDVDLTLLSHNGCVRGMVVEGTLITSYDDYADTVRDQADWQDEDTDPEGLLSEREWDDLMQVEPTMWGSEGPMMNYYYPVDSIDDDDDAEAAAVKLGGNVCLCVVNVDSTYGLALTGGGMDLSWDICKAFVLLGVLPPVHFRNLPNQGEWDEDVYLAMMRSLTIQRDWMEQGITRLADLKVRVTERMGTGD